MGSHRSPRTLCDLSVENFATFAFNAVFRLQLCSEALERGTNGIDFRLQFGVRAFPQAQRVVERFRRAASVTAAPPTTCRRSSIVTSRPFEAR